MTRRQLQLCSVVLRESWGWQTKGGDVYRWTRPLTPRQFADLTSLSTDHLSRDLQALVARGVLREQSGCYQLVADPELWKTSRSRPQKPRSRALKPPASTARTALSSPGLKTGETGQRNVALPPESQLSPAGDNWPPARPGVGERADLLPGEERFLQVVLAYVGGLPREQLGPFRAWIHQAGVASVWEALEESFGHGPAAVRHRLHQRLEAEPGPTV